MGKFVPVVLAGVFAVQLWAAPAAGQGLQALESLLSGTASGDGPGSLLPLMIKGVGLTDEQSERVKEVLASRRKTLRSLFRQLRAANEELANKLFVPEEVSENDLKPTVQKITQLREKLVNEGLQAVLQVRHILTPEQRAKAARLKEHVEALHAAMSGLVGEKNVESTVETKSAVEATKPDKDNEPTERKE
jgi:Spy/CpxP family protein refolding chaperone